MELPKPITREEQYFSYLSGKISNYPDPPITRIEKYLYYLCKNGTTSGGGGSSDYNDLTNKPSINGVQLSGNKTTEDLKIETVEKKVDHGTDNTTFTLPPNELHVWGEVPELNITLKEGNAGKANVHAFMFISGSTATKVTITPNVTMQQPIEQNGKYIIMVMEGIAAVGRGDVDAT